MIHLDKVEMFFLKALVLLWILVWFDEIKTLLLARSL